MRPNSDANFAGDCAEGAQRSEPKPPKKRLRPQVLPRPSPVRRPPGSPSRARPSRSEAPNVAGVVEHRPHAAHPPAPNEPRRGELSEPLSAHTQT